MKNNEIRIAFCGDINPGGVLTYTGGVSDEVVDALGKYDLRVATLESSIGCGIPFSEKKMVNPDHAYVIYSPDESVSLLKRLRIDAVTLANNHSCDCGLEGLYHTMDVLDGKGIRYCGAGRNSFEAAKALIIEIKGKRIGLIGYTYSSKFLYEPTETDGGLNKIDREKVLTAVKRYKAECDYLFVLMHWGQEKKYRPEKKDFLLARDLIKAGASGVMGSHTHTVQPIMKLGRGVVAMSMGNFVFPDRYIDYPKVTCYPEAAEREKEHPVTNGYPTVQELTYKRIPKHLRIGVVCELILKNGRVRFKKHYTYMGKDHVVIFEDIPTKLKIKLFTAGMYMKFWGMKSKD